MKIFNQKIGISSFCEHLRSLETVYSDSQIVSITHWKEKNTLLLHEFVTFRALMHGDDIYLRIERYSERRGPLHHPRNWRFVFPAKDTVIMTRSVEKVMQEGIDLEVLGRVVFNDDPPTLLDLESVLVTVCNESPEYLLYSENCYFLASTLMQVFATLYGGVREAPATESPES